MKKLLVLVMCLFTSFAYSQNIGVLMDSYVVDRWISDRNFICDKIRDLGGEVSVQVANGDAAVQLKQAKEMIASGTKVLIIVPVDIKEAIEIVDYAASKDVKVIAYDRIIPSDKISLYLSFDNEKVGMLQAEQAVKHIGKGNIILMNGPKSDYNAILFRKGQLEVLKPYVKKGDIKILKDIVLDSWGELNAFLYMQELAVTQTEQIDAVLAANDALANGVISALVDIKADKPIYITGQDAEIQAIQNLINGTQGMTVYKPIKKLAYLAATSAMEMSKGKEVKDAKINTIAGVKVRSILLDPKVVTKDNYMETVIADNHVSIDELTDIKNE